jgi:hypothetical protein
VTTLPQPLLITGNRSVITRGLTGDVYKYMSVITRGLTGDVYKYMSVITRGLPGDVYKYMSVITSGFYYTIYLSPVNPRLRTLLCTLLITRYPTIEHTPIPSTHHPLTGLMGDE